MSQRTDPYAAAHKPCPVCGADAGESLIKLRYALFDDLDMPGEKMLTGCPKCGMIYDEVAFSEEKLAEYYRRNEHYAASSTGGTGGVSDDNTARYERILRALAPKRSGMILDVGCGQGGFVDYCRRRGFEAVGIEPSTCSRAAALALGLEVFESFNAFRAAYPEAPVAAIVLSHVLEHLLDPLSFLQQAVQLAPGADVYLETPDASSYLATTSVRWREVYFEHVQHFREGTLAAIAQRAGVHARETGACSFSPAQTDTRCCFLAGTADGMARPVETLDRCAESHVGSLPSVPQVLLPKETGRLALWGISQYAMLLMGSRPELAGIGRLFDASPAKIGRTIRGVRIESPKALLSLDADTVLLLPRSYYTDTMLAHLAAIDYKGDYLTV